MRTQILASSAAKHRTIKLFILIVLASIALFLFQCELFYGGFEQNRNKGTVNPNDPTAFQDKLEFDDSGFLTKEIRSGDIPSDNNSNLASIRFSDLKTGATIGSVQNLAANAYGDATQTYNVFAGDFVSVFCIIDATSQGASRVYFQLDAADQYIEFAYSPAIPAGTTFRTTFKIPSYIVSGQITAIIAIEGSSAGVYSNDVRVTMNVVSEEDQATPPTTQTLTTLTSTLTTQTTFLTVSSTTTTLCFSTGCDGRLLIGGTLNDYIAEFSAIAPVADGGYILLGTSDSTDGDFAGQGGSGGNLDLAVVKLTASGSFDSAFDGDGIRLIGGTATEKGNSIAVTADGGYILTGESGSSDGDFTGQGAHGSSDMVAIKLTASGAFDTAFDGDGIRLIGGTGTDISHNIVVTADGGYILTGESGSSDGDFTGQGAHGSNDMVVIKLTASGAFDAAFDGDGIRLIGGTGYDRGYTADLTADGGYILLGISDSTDGDFAGQGGPGGNSDMAVVKLTASGAFDTAFDGDGIRLIGGTGNFDYGFVAAATADGGCILIGQSGNSDGDYAGQGAHGNMEIVVVKLTASGAFDTAFDGDGIRLFGGVLNDRGDCIAVTYDGGYILTGDSFSTDGDFIGQGNNGSNDLVLIKLTASGAFDTAFDGDGILLIGGGGSEEGRSVAVTADGGYIVAGFSQSTDGDFAGQGPHGGNDIAVIRLNADGSFF